MVYYCFTIIIPVSPLKLICLKILLRPLLFFYIDIFFCVCVLYVKTIHVCRYGTRPLINHTFGLD